MNPALDTFTSWFFRHRGAFLCLFAALTLAFAWSAAHLKVDASFNKSLPGAHPFIQTFTKHQAAFGGPNRVIVALMAKEGDIFTPAFFRELRTVTDEVAFLPAVDRSQVHSLFTPNVRYIEVVEDGFSGGTVVPADFAPTPAHFARVRENIVKSGRLGQLVANDFTGAIVGAQIVEIDPRSGAKIDYTHVASALEAIRERVERESNGAITVHIIGFAKVIGDVSAGARGVLALFALSILVTSLLVWNYAGRWKLAAAPIACSFIAVIWQLGAVSALGFGIDPFSILVPFLVFAIAVSHGVQMVGVFRTQIFIGLDSTTAARTAFRQLLVPGALALVTDTLGFITIRVIAIETIQDLALTASIGVAAILVTNLFLLPIVLSRLTVPASYGEWIAGRRARTRPFWEWLAREMKPRPSLVVLALAGALGAWSWLEAREVRIGDTQAGVPELRHDSRYNRDSRVITSEFSVSVDILSVIVETVPNGCVDYDVVAWMDRLTGHLQNVPGVQSIVSVTTVAKTINAAFSEGSLKWRILPRNPHALAQAVAPIETGTGLLNSDGSVMPVMIFLADHKAETLRAVTTAVESFAAAHPSPKATLRLAGGNAGVMAATNEVVAAAQTPILLWIFGTVSALCLLTFRSFRATLCIVLPLVLVSYLSYALMVSLNIGLKTSTLPVVALGVGIGVDYGIYIFARLATALRAGVEFEDAMFMAFEDSGAAIFFTGLTLAIGVSTWVFSDLKFQADMGLLLAFMFLANMLAALLLIPAMARWLYHHHANKTRASFPGG